MGLIGDDILIWKIINNYTKPTDYVEDLEYGICIGSHKFHFDCVSQ